MVELRLGMTFPAEVWLESDSWESIDESWGLGSEGRGASGRLGCSGEVSIETMIQRFGIGVSPNDI
jgi:hypothetical protein